MTTTYYILELLVYISLLYNFFLLKPTSSKIRLFCFGFGVLAGGIYNLFCDANDILAIPSSIIILILCILLFKDKLFFLLTKIVFINLFIQLIPDTILYVYHIMTTTEYSTATVVYKVCFITFYIMYTIVPFFLKNKFHSCISLIKSFDFMQYLIIMLISIFDFFIFSVSALLIRPTGSIKPTGRLLLMICIFLVIISSFIILFQYLHLRRYNLVLQQNDKMNKQLLRQEEQYYNDIQKKNEDLRAFRHDYNYHIHALQSLANKEDQKALHDYIYSLSKIKSSISYIQTNNLVANSIINYFFESYHAVIKFNIDGLFPNNLFVENTDLCVILSNVLKNAIESALQTSSPSILLRIFANDAYATIYVENSSKEYSQTFLSDLKTTKDDIVNHGFGLKNITNVVEKYCGNLDLEYKNRFFYTRIYLNNINQF